MMLPFKTITEHAHNLYRMSSNLRSIAYDLHYCPGSKNYRKQNKIYELSNILFIFPYFIEISKNKILISRCCYRQSCVLNHYATATLILSYIQIKFTLLHYPYNSQKLQKTKQATNKKISTSHYLRN
jgi:uncharacterized membrane protein YkgB